MALNINKKVFSSFFCLSVFLFCSAVPGRPKPLDTLFLAAENAPINTRCEALGNAGCAIADEKTSFILNPAHTHPGSEKGGVKPEFFATYGRDDMLFKKHILSAGASVYLNEKLSLCGAYKYLSAGKDRYQHEYIFNFSGSMVNRGKESELVNMGINIRYQYMMWDLKAVSKTTSTAPDSIWTITESEIMNSTVYKRITADIGFYQKKLSDALDMGLTLNNIFGYIWEESDLTRKDTSFYRDSVSDSIEVDSVYYTNDKNREKGKLHGFYKPVTLGFLYNSEVGSGNLSIKIPIDFKLYGIFNRDIHLAFHSGIEIGIKGKFFFRFGYARAPSDYITCEKRLKNSNMVSGGGGIKLKPVTLNLYFRENRWGIGGALSF